MLEADYPVQFVYKPDRMCKNYHIYHKCAQLHNTTSVSTKFIDFCYICFTDQLAMEQLMFSHNFNSDLENVGILGSRIWWLELNVNGIQFKIENMFNIDNIYVAFSGI